MGSDSVGRAVTNDEEWFMKIDIPNELLRELLEKLEAARKQRRDFDKTVWGKLYNLLNQYKFGRDKQGPRGHSKRARAEAISRFHDKRDTR